MQKYQCDNCGKEYKAWPSQRPGKTQYCSQQCKILFQTGKHHGGNTKKCKICNKIFYIKPFAAKKRVGCSKECGREWRKRKTGNKAFAWRGGVWKHNSGYLEQPYTQASGVAVRVLQHRRVIEEHLGRKLIWERKKGGIQEVVHHINENKKDNRIENLALMSSSEHSRLHKIK